MIYRTLIIEDEHHLRDALSILLEIIAPDKIQIVGYAEDADDAINIIDSNTHYIISYSREGTIHMHDNISIPISRSNKDAFFKLMKDGDSG